MNLMADDSFLLSLFVDTLGIIVRCSIGKIDWNRMAGCFVEFLALIRKHPDPAVRRSVVRSFILFVSLSSTRGSQPLPPFIYLNAQRLKCSRERRL